MAALARYGVTWKERRKICPSLSPSLSLSIENVILVCYVGSKIICPLRFLPQIDQHLSSDRSDDVLTLRSNDAIAESIESTSVLFFGMITSFKNFTERRTKVNEIYIKRLNW